MTYRAPIHNQMLAYRSAQALSGGGRDGVEMAETIVRETAKLAENIFAPIDALGDRVGAKWCDGEVSLPNGFGEAFKHYREAGWATLSGPEEAGGQALPFAIAAIVQEQLSAANLAFSLCMMLSQGAIAAISAHAEPVLRDIYLPPLVEGRWTGTMNLTEPQAGSDLSQIRTRATPVGDGSYRINGTKIFITWGEHNLAENIVHLVLARLPDAPPGSRGISLFLVPKFIPDADGQPGERNDVRCVAIEHKLGIHASPTCTMQFEDGGRCIGWLVGAPNTGLEAMFTMMNHARVNVGLQGVGVAEIATQKALRFARERLQSARYGADTRDPVEIIDHADVRRMLLTMRALTDAARAIAYLNAAAVDAAHDGNQAAQARANILTPITKAFATDIGVEVASLGVQVFGGMGFVEETGIAQHYRDVRITPIYEGTNGIQALDLIGRKLSAMPALLDDLASWVTDSGDASWSREANALRQAIAELTEVTETVSQATAWDKSAASVPYLRHCALVLGGVLLLREALLEPSSSKVATARFFVDQMLPQAIPLAHAVRSGGKGFDGDAELLFSMEG